MAASRFERARAGWRFQLQWVFANAVAGAVTLTVTGAMIRTDSLNADMVVVVFGVVLGASLGIIQWLVLRRLIPQAHQWVLASLVGGAMLAISSLVIGAAVGGPLGGAVIGAALGAMQWLILRRQVSRAYLYLLSSIVGFALALTEGEAIGFTVDGAAGWLTGGTLFGILVGVITGAVLFWLLRQPILDI